MSDLIKRQDAIDAIECVTWYHQNRNKDMVSGANSDEHQAWYKAEDIYDALEAIPSADRPQEWIPCSERLPIEYEVLCCDIYKNCIVGHPFADDSASTGFCAESEGVFLYECIAWMPLPKPWKGADDEV